MNIFIYFAILLTIIGFQIITCRLAYKRNELGKATADTRQYPVLMKEQSSSKQVNKVSAGHYAIAHKESLTPLAKSSSISKRQPKILEKV